MTKLYSNNNGYKPAGIIELMLISFLHNGEILWTKDILRYTRTIWWEMHYLTPGQLEDVMLGSGSLLLRQVSCM